MIRRCVKPVWLFLAAFTILLAVAITAARLLLPAAGEYRELLVSRLAGVLGQPLQVDTIEAGWYRLGPRFKLFGLTLFDKREPHRPLFKLKEVDIGLDLIDSLFSGALQIDSLSLAGARLAVVRHHDGQVRMHGFGATPADARGDAGLLFARWALSRDRIALKIGQISWRDDTVKTGEILVRDVVLHLRNDGRRHQLNGSAILPAVFGERFSFAIDLQGEVFAAKQWDADIFLSGDRLHVGRLLAALRLPRYHLAAANSGLKIWGRWQRGRLHSLSGAIQARDVAFLTAGGKQPAAAHVSPPPSKQLRIAQLAGKFAWERQAGGWRLGISDFSLRRNGRQWQSRSMRFALSTTGPVPILTASCAYLDLQDASNLVLASGVLPADAAASLKALRPTGRLQDAQIYFRSRQGGPVFHLASGFAGLSARPWHHLPGFTGLDGHLVINDQGGVVEMASRDARLDFRRLFRTPLAVARVQGRVLWQRLPSGIWRVVTEDLSAENRDVHLRASLDLLLPGQGGSPYMNLLVNFTAPSVAHTALYLPAARMHPGLVRWLDQAIVGGRVRRGTAMFNGRLRDFPFDHQEGVFKVHFELDRGVLNYAPGWPSINEIATSVDFHNRRLDIKATAQSLSSRIGAAHVVIDDLAAKPALLVVEGTADGPTSDALKFLRESPLKQKFARYLSAFTAAGKSHLTLSVSKPLNKAPAVIHGSLDMTDSRLTVAKGMDLSEIKGRLHFNNTGLSADHIDALVLGMPSVIDITTPEMLHAPVINFRARGRADDQAIARFLPAFLTTHLSGAADWRAILSVPLGPQAGSLRSKLLIQSALRGIAVDLPVPLRKEQDESVDFSLKIPLPRSPDAPLLLHMGDRLSGIFALNDQLRLARGEFRFGPGTAQLPQQEGLSLAGEIPYVSSTDWQPYLAMLQPSATAPVSAPLRMINMKIDRLALLAHDFNAVQLKAVWYPQLWDIKVASRELKGDIKWPLTAGAPLQMRLDYLYLDAVGEVTDRAPAMDPRDLPALDIHSKQFKFSGIDFGRLLLTAVKQPAGLRFDKLELISDVMQVTAHGKWLRNPTGVQSSVMDVGFNSGDLGKAFTRLGYADSIKEGRGHIDASIHWPGSPASFTVKKLAGVLNLTIKKGRLLAVEPGAGRIFGLLSLQALPRRLSLDFSDIFKKGFSFDRIQGSFKIADGEATTRDLEMKSPAARILTKGRVGLLAHDYDQEVTVMPHIITTGLPVAGAVAGGLGVGVAILLAERLLKSDVDKVAKVKYTVTGSWDAPVVERLQEGKTK